VSGVPDVLNLPPAYFQVFFLVFVRVAAVIMTLPVLSSRNIPPPAKIGLSGLLAFVLTPTLSSATPPVPTQMSGFVLSIGTEVLMGLVFAFAVQIIFSGIQMTGQVLGIQMGLNIASTLDPVSQSTQISYVDQLYALIAGMVFLTINGHHWVIQALQQSFTIVPVGQFQLNPAVSDSILSLVMEALIISIRIGLPISAALLLTDIAFLIIGRTAPQMNIFFVGQPVKIGVGLVALALAMPVMVVAMSDVFKGINADLLGLLQAIHG
jgi:flagellar biosynthetic protein FliR